MQEKQELYSREVEENVLGSLIVFDECKIYIKKLNDDDFYIKQNIGMFKIIKELYERKIPIDLVSIKEMAVDKKMNTEKVFTKAADVCNIVVTSETIEYYINKLKNYSTKRHLAKKAKEILQQIYTENIEMDATELKKECLEKIASVKTNDEKVQNDSMKSVIVESIEEIEKKYKKREENTYKTGFFDLDKATDGLHEKELTIIRSKTRGR